MLKVPHKTLLIIILLSFYIGSFNTLTAQNDEYMVQAVFSEKFTRFISWPDDSKVKDTTKPFTISILGETKATNYFVQLFKDNDKKIKNKKVRLIINPETDDIMESDLIYFGEIDIKSIEKIETIINGLPILTISEMDSPEKYSVIYFYQKNNKILFNINTEIAKIQHLKISHLLLNLCKKE